MNIFSYINVVEGEENTRIFGKDFSLLICNDFCISFIYSLDKHIKEKLSEGIIEKEENIKAIIYIAIKSIIKIKDIYNYGINSISIRKLPI